MPTTSERVELDPQRWFIEHFCSDHRALCCDRDELFTSKVEAYDAQNRPIRFVYTVLLSSGESYCIGVDVADDSVALPACSNSALARLRLVHYYWRGDQRLSLHVQFTRVNAVPEADWMALRRDIRKVLADIAPLSPQRLQPVLVGA